MIELHAVPSPSAWVTGWASLIPAGPVLDVAAGGGRHSRYLAALGHPVEAVDRDVSSLPADPLITLREADLEKAPWPYSGQQFSGIVVTNYLHRSLFPFMLDVLAPSGLLIYETFMAGNERYGRPSNPDFLLRTNELLELTAGLQVLGFEQGYVAEPKPGMTQRLCARKPVPAS